MPHVSLLGARRRFLVAVLCAACLALVLPGTSEAHAILLRSDPAKDAVLHVAPDRVRMWFSETLNPALSTVVVESGANQRVDNRDAQIAPGDASEMDVTLQPNLPPAVYVVVWRTDSNDDAHHQHRRIALHHPIGHGHGNRDRQRTTRWQGPLQRT